MPEVSKTVIETDCEQAKQTQAAFTALCELSRLLNTGLDTEALSICIQLLESGVNPNGLALCIRELTKMKSEVEGNDENCNTRNRS